MSLFVIAWQEIFLIDIDGREISGIIRLIRLIVSRNFSPYPSRSRLSDSRSFKHPFNKGYGLRVTRELFGFIENDSLWFNYGSEVGG